MSCVAPDYAADNIFEDYIDRVICEPTVPLRHMALPKSDEAKTWKPSHALKSSNRRWSRNSNATIKDPRPGDGLGLFHYHVNTLWIGIKSPRPSFVICGIRKSNSQL